MTDRAGDRPPADIDRRRDLAAALAQLLVAAYLVSTRGGDTSPAAAAGR